jgi:hypothetical protein
MTRSTEQPIHVFVSYAHADRRWLDRLVVHLKPLRELCKLEQWDDTRIQPGSNWKTEIRAAIDRASVAVLLISADFLASDFIRTDELPPLLKAAEEEGAVILPVIVSPCLFTRVQHLAQFQAVNDPGSPLVSLDTGEQEAAFVRVASSILDVVEGTRSSRVAMSAGQRNNEDFLETDVWERLLKIGDWILDRSNARILGAGPNSFLVSRGEYGRTPFTVVARLQFSDFLIPESDPRRLGMNAGVIFGWNDEKRSLRYYNVLLTGSAILLEQNGFESTTGKSYRHLTQEVPLRIESGQPVDLELTVDDRLIQVTANGTPAFSLARPTGVVGRVGLRPWRSKLDCLKFVVSSGLQPSAG